MSDQERRRVFICEGGPLDGRMLGAAATTNRMYIAAEDGLGDYIYDLKRVSVGGRRWTYVGRDPETKRPTQP